MSWGNPDNLLEKSIAALLMPAAFAYGSASYSRLLAYKYGVLKQEQLAAPVISIGNITVGGTGKTPLVIDIANYLNDNGYKVGIVSRGYKRKSQEQTTVVSNGHQILVSCYEAGDEPYLIAQSAPKAVVIVGSSKVASAKMAIEKFACNIILVDDGFQHLPLRRNHDIVLLDYNDSLDNDHVLPAGRLREPLAALSRADSIVITKVPDKVNEQKLAGLEKIIRKYAPAATISKCNIHSDKLIMLASRDTLSLDALNNKPVIAFSAIARPQKFQQDLKVCGAQIKATCNFGDHHWYTMQDIQRLKNLFDQSKAELIITTEKDAVKLLPDLLHNLPVAILKQKVNWLDAIPPVIKGPKDLHV